MIKRTFLAKGLPYASEISLKNAQDILAHVEWNRDNDVKVFRLTSCLFPWLSEYEMEDLPDFDKIKENLAAAGAAAKAAPETASPRDGIGVHYRFLGDHRDE